MGFGVGLGVGLGVGFGVGLGVGFGVVGVGVGAGVGFLSLNVEFREMGSLVVQVNELLRGVTIRGLE